MFRESADVKLLDFTHELSPTNTAGMVLRHHAQSRFLPYTSNVLMELSGTSGGNEAR